MSEKTVSARAVFTATLKIADPAERARYLDQACQGQPPLRARVEALLRAHVEAGQFLDGTALGQPQPLVQEGPGTLIGRYRLLEVIGEGGFGVVYRAEQSAPVHRQVALKIVKPGMDTRQVIARFEAERQALAMMDHPNIAKVLDAGATDTGRPYFVMELVQGVPITDYCDQRQLSTGQRLNLFIEVCHAVQHAHQKGIIHRDLKPSNILVREDGRPVPKVIDFGVAKAIGHKLTEKTLVTLEHQFIGTPVYCSPEQIDPMASDVDTRADIYSLGVILYELLTGHTPFDPVELKQAGWNEVVRIVRETDPPRPSTRLTTLGKKELDTVARLRGAEPAKLPSQLRGDLDWIVMKALEKDRNRRYASTSTLALDIQRFLNHEPVSAAAPTVAYRAGKFIRRHRLGVAAAAAVAMALLGGIGLSLWQAHQAEKARQVALASRREAENLVTFMLADLSKQLAPLSREDIAEAILGQATNYFRNLPSETLTPEEVYNRSLAYENLGNLNLNQGRWNMDAAEPYYRQALALRQKALATDPNNFEWQRGMAQLYIEFSEVFTQLSENEEYLRYIGLAQNILTNLLARRPNDFECRWLLGQCYFLLGQNAGNSTRQMPQADPLLATLRHSVRHMEALHQERPENQEVHFHLGYQYFILAAAMALSTNLEHNLESLQHHQRSQETYRRLIQQAPQHYQAKFHLAFSLVWKGWLLMRMARPGDAEEAFRSLDEGFRILDEIRPYRGAGLDFQLVETRYYHSLGMLRRETDPSQAYADFWRSIQVFLKSSHPTRRQSLIPLHRGIHGQERYEFYYHFREHWVRMMKAAKAKGDVAAIHKYWSDLCSLLQDRAEILDVPSVMDQIGVVLTQATADDRLALMLDRGTAVPVSSGYSGWIKQSTNQAGPPGQILIPANAVWQHHNSTSAPPSGWMQPGFNAQDWPADPAPLGYGETWIKTTIPTNRATVYFRHEFSVDRPDEIKSLRLRLLRDDGAAVYLNGMELLRDNLPDGPLHHQILATDAVNPGTGEHQYFDFYCRTTNLLKGRNVVAVEVHQAFYSSSDLSFGLELEANPPRLPDWMRQHPLTWSRTPKINSPAFHRAMLFLTESLMPESLRQARGRWISSSFLALLESSNQPPDLAPVSLATPPVRWKYLDDGSDQGSRWRETSFDDRAWPSFRHQFSEYNHDPKHPKPITYYFRMEFTATNQADGKALLLRLRRNDAVAMHLNGQEILRDNLPGGPIHYRTAAQCRNELEPVVFLVSPMPTLQSTNILAVELHVAQNFLDRPGIFSLELLATVPPVEELLREIKPEEVLKFFNDQGLPLPEEALKPAANPLK